MSGNTELLNFVYQNSQMGMESLSQLLEIAEDEEFRSCMEKQLDKYREFHNEAKRLLQERGHNEKSLGMFDKLKTYLMINMQTMSDKSTSHLAQMLIEGSSMGVTNALQDLRKYEDADTEILRLMRKLYKFEEKNVETYWDKNTSQNYGTYEEDNSTYQIWLEDAQSIAAKVKLASKYKLAGVAAWKLGFENSGIWQVITDNLQ